MDQFSPGSWAQRERRDAPNLPILLEESVTEMRTGCLALSSNTFNPADEVMLDRAVFCEIRAFVSTAFVAALLQIVSLLWRQWLGSAVSSAPFRAAL